jgi:hypothetical protein
LSGFNGGMAHHRIPSPDHRGLRGASVGPDNDASETINRNAAPETNAMDSRFFALRCRRALVLALWMLLSTIVTACAFAGEPRKMASHHDGAACESFGAHYGSPEHARCLLVQQQRRDAETTDALERQRLSSEIARNNVETVRRMRCEREAKRERKSGMRPRPCW